MSSVQVVGNRLKAATVGLAEKRSALTANLRYSFRRIWAKSRPPSKCRSRQLQIRLPRPSTSRRRSLQIARSRLPYQRPRATAPRWSLLAAAILAVAVGYFIGREHIKYEIRQSFCLACRRHAGCKCLARTSQIATSGRRRHLAVESRKYCLPSYRSRRNLEAAIMDPKGSQRGRFVECIQRQNRVVGQGRLCHRGSKRIPAFSSSARCGNLPRQ